VKRTPFPRFWLSLAALVLALLPAPVLASAAPAYTFFQGTQFPLTVYFLRGTLSGPTVMVQGGIQGDEVSGYLAAQILTRAKVHRGNLLIVPRANIPSVHARKRQINVDLNRRFDRDYNAFYEDRLARVIRFLLAGSDAFIHLHEGSGFYHPTYLDAWRNPFRYGQSIIIDTPVFQDRIHLAQAVTTVLGRLNHAIVPADYRFRLFNTDTFASDTAYPEQRKSLTYYALNRLNIPALAIEVSKNIDGLGWKVLRQLKATEMFLDYFGVELTLPFVSERDVARYAKRAGPVMVNGRSVAYGKQAGLTVSPLSRIHVGNGEGARPSLFDPAVAVFASDRPDVNIVDSPRLALSPFTVLSVSADGERLARVRLCWNPEWTGADPAPRAGGPPLFACWLNKELRFVPAGETLEAVLGDQLVLEGVWGGLGADEILNFKGYVSRPGKNDGQDMGREIILDPESLISRYVKASESKDQWFCRVVRETAGVKRSGFRLRIVPRNVNALGLKNADGEKVFIPWSDGQKKFLSPGEYRLEEVWSNGPKDKILVTQDHTTIPWGGVFSLGPGDGKTIVLRQATTFKPIGRMTLVAPNS